ncbi:UNVERIFIED_CONTAM: hypothetical protein FKN15_038409 [Acipenser sinensis]
MRDQRKTMCIILADKSEGVLKAVDAPPYKKKKDVNIPVNTLSTSLNKLNNTGSFGARDQAPDTSSTSNTRLPPGAGPV